MKLTCNEQGITSAAAAFCEGGLLIIYRPSPFGGSLTTAEKSQAPNPQNLDPHDCLEKAHDLTLLFGDHQRDVVIQVGQFLGQAPYQHHCGFGSSP